MIINLDSLSSKKFVEDNAKADMNVRHMDAKADSKDLIVPEMLSHPSNLGPMIKGVNKHFYSVGGFNLIQLIFYVLHFTGPANLFLTSYSISVDSINALRRKVDRNEILSVKFLIDNRVRSISPKPFDVLVNTFPGAYRCCAMHAKVALIWNDTWKVDIVGSQNATCNPKLERGVIFVQDDIFDFDKKMLDYEFDKGTT